MNGEGGQALSSAAGFARRAGMLAPKEMMAMLHLSRSLGHGNRSVLAAYLLAVIILVIDLWVPRDLDTAIYYTVSIALFSLQRSRLRLWIGTAIFMVFLFADVVVGSPPILWQSPSWLYVANRSFLACALLVIAVIVHCCINRRHAIESGSALLAKQNEQLRASETLLEQRVLERQLAVEKVQEAERLFRCVVDNMPLGVVVKVGSRYRTVNRVAAERVAMSPAEVERITDQELFRRAGLDEALWGQRTADQDWAITHNQLVAREEKIRLPDGRVRHFLVTTFPIPGAISNEAVVGIASVDVTELRKVENKLRQTQKMDALGRLAGGVAHDFNNIVGAIQGFARFIVQDTPAGSSPHGHANRILSASARAKELVQQVLTFSRRADIRRQRLSVAAAIAEATALLKAVVAASTTIESDEAMPAAFIEADPAQISQVLVNLGVNANDALAGKAGSVAFSARRRAGTTAARESVPRPGRVVAGNVDPAMTYVVIRVRDTGAGMEHEVLEHIFEPFFTTKPAGAGTGLGLAVVHGIILGHQGAIAVASRPGRGTEVDIWLPEAVEATPEHRRPVETDTSEPRRSCILIVDDDADFADMLAISMERLGYDAVVVADPRDAVALLEQDVMACDLIITDQTMPNLSGLELIKFAKQKRPDLPCILCSAYANNVTPEVALRSGVSAYMQKPIGPTALEETVRELLRLQPPSETAPPA